MTELETVDEIGLINLKYENLTKLLLMIEQNFFDKINVSLDLLNNDSNNILFKIIYEYDEYRILFEIIIEELRVNNKKINNFSNTLHNEFEKKK